MVIFRENAWLCAIDVMKFIDSFVAPIHLACILHPHINAEHEAGQTEINVCQVFDMTRTGIEPILPVLARALPTVPQIIYQHVET